MRPIAIKISRSKNIIHLANIRRLRNQQSIRCHHKQINTNNCYRFSVQSNVPIYENNQSLNLMLKQLQIVQKQTFNHSLINQQKIKQISLKIKVCIQQQIGFINLNQAQLTKYLQKLSYPLQILKDQLRIIIDLIQDFISNIEAINMHQLNSKYKILQFIHSCLFCKPKKQNLMARLSEIIQSQIKIRQALLFYKSYSCSSNITNTHPSQFAQTWKKIYMLSYITTQQMNEGYQLLSHTYGLIGGAIMMKQRLKGFQFYYYYLQKSWRSLSSILIYKNMRVENAKKLLNVFEEDPIKKFVQLTYDTIVTNKIIYIPAVGDFQQKINIFEQTKDSIPVRVLYHKQLPIIQDKKDSFNQNDCIQNILIHSHGGGFVALSSHSTQNYTRKWANQTKIPVFSIDYRMAPDHAFPQAHNDCFQVYRFLTTQLHKYMRIKPVNIFLGGDSAGANLSCAITTFALKNQLIIPKALYLAYPLLNVQFRYYSSRKYILNDPLLQPALIKTFVNSYFQNQADYTNPIASPLLLTEQFVGGNIGDSRFPLKWPKTVIAVGTKDPLRDQSLLLMERMTDSNINCKCFLYENMSHAFLSLDQLIKNTSKTIDHSIQILKQMIAAQKDSGK